MRHWQTAVLVCGICWLQVASAKQGTAAEAPPATAAEAAKVLDLAKFPRAPKSDPPSQASLARLSYSVPGSLTDAYAFQKKALTGMGWKELPGAYSSEQYASGTFAKQGFTLSVSALPDGDKVGVSVINHGNVELAKVPVPSGMKSLYAGPVSLMLVTAAAQDVTKSACRKLMEQAQWEAYGTPGDSMFFRKNAVLLQVNVSAAPAQDNQTVVTLSSELMSVELPCPKEARDAQYSESTTALSFDTPQSSEDVAAFYKKALGALGWKPTTDNLIQVDFRSSMIFRNSAKDLIDVTVQKSDLGTRALVTHQTAARVAEEEARAKAAIAKREAEKNAPKTKVAIATPVEATNVESKANHLEFQLKSGKAKGVVTAWQKQFIKDGWKEQVAVVENEAGSISLTRGDLTLSFTYVDPGFIPAEVTVSVIGGDLDVLKPKSP